MTVAIAWIRVVSGVHFISDVVAGFLFAAFFSLFFSGNKKRNSGSIAADESEKLYVNIKNFNVSSFLNFKNRTLVPGLFI